MSRTISSTTGKHLKITVFGGSHEEEIGVTISGLPSAFDVKKIDMEKLQRFLDRRAPGNSPYATARKEADRPVLKTAEPLTFIIKNTNIRPRDYSALQNTPRPGHADYTARIKYGNDVNMSGGGPFSGRMTAPLCIAGGIAKQILEEEGISIDASLASVGGVSGEAMFDEIEKARAEGDSVGGIVHCIVSGVPAGLGGPMYDGLESYISPIIFGIPAVKGLSFGNGFEASSLRGSENNDEFVINDGAVMTKSNNSGGILGGISTGMDITLDVAFKPTPSISRPQKSVNLETMEECTIEIGGRHDPCVAYRAVPVIEAAVALGILDAELAED